MIMWCGIYRIARDFKGNHSAKASCCVVQMAMPKSEFKLPLVAAVTQYSAALLSTPASQSITDIFEDVLA